MQVLFLRFMMRLTKPELDLSMCWTPQELQFFETYKDARKDDILGMYKNKEVQVTQKMIHQVFARQQVKTKLPFLFNHKNPLTAMLV